MRCATRAVAVGAVVGTGVNVDVLVGDGVAVGGTGVGVSLAAIAAIVVAGDGSGV